MSTPPVIAVTPRRARVEIIPLIDVIFFLLATFVLFTLSLNRVRSLPVPLPFSGGESGSDAVTIQVSEDGAIFWNRELVTAAEVPSRLAIYRQQVDDTRVLVATDDRAKLGPAVRVLDEVRRAGITKLSVETRVRPTGK